ncbi:MAG: T9SS type A sorting domain-containing protein [Flavobacteriales bacterium]|nr:T9SS type A sorting domain-containing protein [Flavobacteriales bacterium]
MRPQLSFGVVLCHLLPALCSAQITQTGTYYERLGFVHTLTTGPKLLHHNDTSLTLFEPDMTVYATLTYPAPPAGYFYTFHPMYITETLFDTDPQNFEFVMTIASGGNAYGTMVIRQDGTVLLTDTTHSPAAQYGGDYFTGTPGISNTPIGTIMVLCDPMTFPQDLGCVMYTLPGTLPCLDCTGPILMDGDAVVPASSGLQAFPDPASSQITFMLASAIRSRSADLQVMAADGRLVHEEPMTGSSHQLDVRTWSSGTYHARVVSPSGVIAQCTFLVQR